MRVVHIIDSLGFGGAQKSVVLLAKVIGEHASELVVLSLQERQEISFDDELRADGAEIHYFPAARLLSLRRIIAMTKFLRQAKADIVHTHLTYGNIVGIIAARLAGIPVISMCHSSGIDPTHHHPLRYSIETWLLRFAAHMVTGDSHSAADAQRPRLKGKSIFAVPNAVPVPATIPEGKVKSLRTELVGNSECPLIIAVGRLSVPKGYADLLVAMDTVRMKHPDAFLVIVGKGHLQEELQAQINALGLSESVLLTGARQDVSALLSASDIYVSSSHWEGLALALLEAMMSGLPVVATAVGDVPRVVLENTGIIVPPHQPEKLAQALIALLDNEEMRALLGRHAQEHALRYHSPKPWAQLLFSLYEKVLSGTQMGSLVSVIG